MYRFVFKQKSGKTVFWQFSLEQIFSVNKNTVLMPKTFLFQPIQFRIVLFDLEAMAMKGYSAFPKTPALQKP